MKKILKSLTALALVALAASCAKEQVIAPEGDQAMVSFTVSTPELMTKAIADGNTVDKVSCNVYDETGLMTSVSKIVDMSAGKATFQVKLLTGKTYSFLFWAYKDGAPYTLDAANKKVTVAYDGVSNDESRDAFYAYIAPEKISGTTINRTVTLYRPFAQVNLGVGKDDVTAAAALGISVNKSAVKFTGIANVLNLEDGTVSGTADAEFTVNTIPSENLTVNDKAYTYLSMNYILVGKTEKSLTDAEFKLYKDDGTTLVNTISVPNVPVQGNYRTNIIGNRLFTADVNVNIVVDPAFEKPDYEVEIWDGASVNKPSTNADGNYVITKASELAWVAQQVNAGTTFEGKTVKLENDIDLLGNEWTPIGTATYSFAGTFDGGDHIISNLAVSSSEQDSRLGLFGSVTGTIKNFTVKGAKVASTVTKGTGGRCGVAAGMLFAPNGNAENIKVVDATVSSTHYTGGIAGYAYGSIKNCSVENATLTIAPVLQSDGNYDDGDKVGGILGHWGESNYPGYEISGCSVKNVTIKGYRDMGGIVGIAQQYDSVKSCSIEGVTITVDKTHDYKSFGTENSKYNVGNYIGRYNNWTGAETDNTGSATINY